jgi:hypothetical protein
MPKISIAEAILLLMYIGATDLVGFLLIFIGLDDFFILDLLTFPVTQIYFRIKGVRAGYDLVMNALELIPYLGVLPLRTIGVAIVIWKDRHPEQAEIVEETIKFVPASSQIQNAKIKVQNDI